MSEGAGAPGPVFAPDDRTPRHKLGGRGRALIVVVAVAALVAGGLVVVGSGSGSPGGSAEQRAVRTAIKKFRVKPIDLTKIAFAPRAAGTPTVTFSGPGSSTPSPTTPSPTPAPAPAPAGMPSPSSGAGATTTTSLPPSDGASLVAPPQFGGQLVSLYQQMYTVNAAVSSGESIPSSGAQLEPVSAFAQAVSNTPTDDLNVLYTAVQGNPSWPKVTALYTQLSQTTSTPPSTTGQSPVGAEGGHAPAAQVPEPSLVPAAGGSSPYPYPDSGTTTTFPGATTVPTSPSINEANCPSPAPGGDYGEDGIYAAQVAIDVFTQTDAAVPQQLTIGAEVLGEGTTFTIPDPAWIIVAALLGAAQITHDTLAYDQAKFNDCNLGDEEGQITDIYNNVAYLTALVDSRTTALENEGELIYALVDSQTTQILNQLAAVQASINLQIKVVIEQDLLESGTGSVVEVQIPASQGGYLNAVPIGVQAIVTNALSQMTEANQAVNPAAPEDLAAANAALAANQYRQAYSLYSQAYKEIVQ